jgi:choline dehydrogenase-like flavoprotein
MFVDARRVDRGAELDCDVCVVGAGAAGITLARELARTSLTVCVLESGGLDLDLKTQALNFGENAGHPYRLAASRLRYFGGTTNHWRGWCRPLDEIDFEERDGVPHTGWPIGREELDPYYERARPLCDIRRRTYDADDWARITKTRPLRARDVDSAVFQVSAPTRFGEAYGDELRRAPGVRVLLHGNVVAVELRRDGSRVDRLRVATLGGRRFTVRAGRFVLAAGAIENARLLLASDDVQRRGIGNDNDLVGRFFADHPHIPIGSMLVARDSPAATFYGAHPGVDDPEAECVLVPADRLVRSERFLRSCLVITSEPGPMPRAAEIGRVARDLGGADLSEQRGLVLRSEQAPNPESRVTLVDQKDATGVRRVRLDWRFTELDRRSWRRSLEVTAGALAAAGIGRLHSHPFRDERGWPMLQGSHHIGTARMSREPRRGVVDPDCRVHGVSNLWVAGSAVFPTTGYANPTLTIVALALRLADHLKRGAR